MRKLAGKKLFSSLLAGIMLFSTLPTLAHKNAMAKTNVIAPQGATVGETVYENDFTSSLTGLTTKGVSAGFSWNADVGTAELLAEQDALQIQANSGMKAIALPAVGLTDYVFTAEVKVLSDSGAFGLLTDVKNPATQALGATHYGVYVNEGSDYGIFQYNRLAENYENEQYANPVRELGYSVSTGNTYTLSVYTLAGTSYFYVDGVSVLSCNAHYFGAEGYDVVGVYACASNILISSVSVKALKGVTNAFGIDGTTVRYADADGYTTGVKSFGLRFNAFIDKQSGVYKSAVPSGTYDTSSENVKFGAIILPADLIPENGVLTKETPKALDVPMDKIATQTQEELRFYVSLLNIPEKDYHREYSARVYMKVRRGDVWEYTYASDIFTRSLVRVGSTYYNDADDKVRARLDKAFENTQGYYGKNANTITFSLFADFHYRNGFYMSSVKDMESIMEKAHKNDVDFVVQLGDFCDDYLGSPEITKAYKENKYDLSVFGVYGNHELQGVGATMSYVTPAMTNRADKVVWGTSDGKIGDGSIAYYYFDMNGIRMIFLDTNYGWHQERQAWVHRESLTFNQTYGSGAVTQENALGAKQRSWLKNVIDDAVDREMSCVLFSHHALSGALSQPPADAAEVRKILNDANAKRAGTVLAVLNGHLHSDHFVYQDNILYFDVNTVRNGTYIDEKNVSYGDVTFEREFYDDNGNLIKKENVKVDSLNGADQTNFYADPLSAIVTVSDSGRIVIDGMQTGWFGGVLPSKNKSPWISNGVFDIPVSYN